MGLMVLCPLRDGSPMQVDRLSCLEGCPLKSSLGFLLESQSTPCLDFTSVKAGGHLTLAAEVLVP